MHAGEINWGPIGFCFSPPTESRLHKRQQSQNFKPSNIILSPQQLLWIGRNRVSTKSVLWMVNTGYFLLIYYIRRFLEVFLEVWVIDQTSKLWLPIPHKNSHCKRSQCTTDTVWKHNEMWVNSQAPLPAHYYVGHANENFCFSLSPSFSSTLTTCTPYKKYAMQSKTNSCANVNSV